MNNKVLGSSFEREFADKLAADGFWVHLLRQNDAGQPADMIACKGWRTYLLDCKTVGSQGFKLDRVEPNQASAMTKFEEKSKGSAWFVFKLEDGSIYFNSIGYILSMASLKSVLNVRMIRTYGLTYEEWNKFNEN